MKVAKLIVLVGIITLFVASCGIGGRKDKCPSMGQKTFKTR